jgi:hypothetical protein
MRRLCSLSKTRKEKQKVPKHYIEKEKAFLQFVNRNSHDVTEKLKYDGFEGRKLVQAKHSLLKKLYLKEKSK